MERGPATCSRGGLRVTHKAVVFDCDGVLVDSEGAWLAGIVNAFVRRGVHELVTAPASSLHGGSMHDVVAMLERELGSPVDFDETAGEIYAEIVTALARDTRPMKGAIELLEALRGTRPLAIASNGTYETVEASMTAAGIPNVFDAIVALEGPMPPKPAPDLYLSACERLGVVPERSIAVEDSVTGALSARSAGLVVVGVGLAPGLCEVTDMVVTALGDSNLWELLGCGASEH